MSMFYGKKLLNFRDFLLSESIRPIQINYGSNENLNNKEWLYASSNGIKIKYTFTYINDIYYMIVIKSTTEIMFGSGVDFDIKRKKDFIYLENIFSDKRRDTREIIRVLGNILYIIFEGLKKFDIKEFFFFANNDNLKLNGAYEYIVTNKYFNDSLNKNGYEYIGKEGRDFKFKKRDL